MSEFTIASSFGSYTIAVERGAVSNAGNARVALVDPAVLDRVPFDPARIVLVPGSESSKTLTACETVLVEMNRSGLTRGDLIVAVGGGVVQDVATLASSLYMRGVDWIYVPTTLMAMADSCIGGKSSINAGGIKNLLGNFHPPRQILVDPDFLISLPQQAIASGLAEAVKICFVRGADAFGTFLGSPAAADPQPDDHTVALLAHVLTAKKWFVEIDELDKAERQLLNFGHSFGHAWEAACGFSIQHGIGVAAGMLAALRHPKAAHTDDTARLEAYCVTLLTSVGTELTEALDATDWDVFRTSLRSDKKNSRDVLRLVLPDDGESVRIHELPLNPEQLMIAQHALRSALEEIRI